MGFVKKKEVLCVRFAYKGYNSTDNFDKKKLIALEALFSNGKDWSPSELVDYYKEIGLIDSKYYKISWKGKDDFYIVLKRNV